MKKILKIVFLLAFFLSGCELQNPNQSNDDPNARRIPRESAPPITGKPIVRIEPMGIQNTGNTCYANSAMQTLMLWPKFWAQVDAKFNTLDKKNPRYEFIEAIHLFKEAWDHDDATPKSLGLRLRDIIESGIKTGVYNSNSFSSCGQNDTNEFFNGLAGEIDLISMETSNQISRKNGTPLVKPVDSLSGLVLRIKDDPAKINFRELFENYFAKKEVKDFEDPADTSKKITVDEQISVENADDIIMVLIDRVTFDPATSTRSRINREVDFGNGTINLKDFFADKSKDQIFEIIAMANQMGSADSGHYIAAVDWGNWFKANDSSISNYTDFAQVNNESGKAAYMVILKRQ